LAKELDSSQKKYKWPINAYRNIPSYKENANQNNKEIPSHPSQNGYYQESKQQQKLTRIWELGKTLIHC
jgi:hypothetical protein